MIFFRKNVDKKSKYLSRYGVFKNCVEVLRRAINLKSRLTHSYYEMSTHRLPFILFYLKLNI